MWGLIVAVAKSLADVVVSLMLYFQLYIYMLQVVYVRNVKSNFIRVFSVVVQLDTELNQTGSHPRCILAAYAVTVLVSD